MVLQAAEQREAQAKESYREAEAALKAKRSALASSKDHANSNEMQLS